MDPAHDVPDQLDVLTDALENPGTDLHTVLAVLADDLAAAVPSLLGLRLTLLLAGDPVTLTTGSADTVPAAASLHVPLDELTMVEEGSTVTFYAGRPGAFVDLAADLRYAYGLDGHVVIDGHLDGLLSPVTDPMRTTSIAGLSEFAVINQAIGVLIEQGQPPETAREVLARRAQQAGTTLSGAARQLCDEHPHTTR